jgi:predicted dehydrogenase
MRDPSFPAALAAFVAAVRDAQPVFPDLNDGVRAAEVIEAAERAARSGSTVPLDPQSTRSHAEPAVDVARP